jgi:hypothetical protein
MSIQFTNTLCLGLRHRVFLVVVVLLASVRARACMCVCACEFVSLRARVCVCAENNCVIFPLAFVNAICAIQACKYKLKTMPILYKKLQFSMS